MGALLAGVFCGVLSRGKTCQESRHDQYTQEWSLCMRLKGYIRGDRKIRLFIPDGLRHIEGLVREDTETLRRQIPLRG